MDVLVRLVPRRPRTILLALLELWFHRRVDESRAVACSS
jgi:hypothetical protein